MDRSSAKEVGQLATIDAVQVTRAVNELAKLGFISRRVDAGDRRRVVLKLSAKGRAAFDAIVPVAVELERWLTEDLSDRERAALHSAAAKLLARVNDGLSDLRGQLVPEPAKRALECHRAPMRRSTSVALSAERTENPT